MKKQLVLSNAQEEHTAFHIALRPDGNLFTCVAGLLYHSFSGFLSSYRRQLL